MQMYLPPRRNQSVYSYCDTFDKGFTNALRRCVDLRQCQVCHFTQISKVLDAFTPSRPTADGFSLGLYAIVSS